MGELKSLQQESESSARVEGYVNQVFDVFSNKDFKNGTVRDTIVPGLQSVLTAVQADDLAGLPADEKTDLVNALGALITGAGTIFSND